jgi:hypothetical protein
MIDIQKLAKEHYGRELTEEELANVIAATHRAAELAIQAITTHRDVKAFIEDARSLYQNDDIEIDDNAKLSETDDGAWVQAWVFVLDKEVV